MRKYFSVLILALISCRLAWADGDILVRFGAHVRSVEVTCNIAQLRGDRTIVCVNAATVANDGNVYVGNVNTGSTIKISQSVIDGRTHEPDGWFVAWTDDHTFEFGNPGVEDGYEFSHYRIVEDASWDEQQKAYRYHDTNFVYTASGSYTLLNRDWLAGATYPYYQNAQVNLRAYARPVTNTISYVWNNGVAPASYPVRYTVESGDITLPVPTRTGYGFGGWYTNASFTGTAAATIPAGSFGNKTFYAQWTTNTYSVKFNANGGTGSMSNLSMTYDTAKNLTSNAFVRTGYTFKGWATSASGSVAYSNGQSVNNLASEQGAVFDLYAVWQVNTYSIKFNANGGNGSMSNLSMTYGTAKNLTSNAFVRTGYTFAGWATSSGGSVAYSDGQSVNNLASEQGAVFNLYAKWAANTYELGYDNLFLLCDFAANPKASAPHVVANGTVTVNVSDGTVKLTGKNASQTPVFTEYARASLSQSGMQSFPVQGNTSYTLSATVSDADRINTVRIWIFFFDSNGGYVSTSSSDESGATFAEGANSRTVTSPSGATQAAIFFAATLASGESLTFGKIKVCKTAPYASVSIDQVRKMYKYNSDTYGTLAIPVRTGYAFGGWWTGENGSGTRVEVSSPRAARSQTLYSKWTAGTYTVDFDINYEGGVNPSSKSVTYDSTYGTLPAPARTGYAFEGWYTAASGGTQVTQATKVSITSDQTLYAHWTANTYAIRFNANGGDGSMSNLPMTYGTPKNLTSNTFVRIGYAFAGWATSAGGNAVYSDGQSVNNLSPTQGATVDLYAKWTGNIYELGFDNLFLLEKWACSHSAAYMWGGTNGITVDTMNGTITVQAQSAHYYTAYGKSIGYFNMAVSPNTSYTVKWKLAKTSTSAQVYWIPLDSSYNYVNGSSASVTAVAAQMAETGTFTTPANCENVQLFFNVHAAGETETFSDIKVCKTDPYASVSIDQVRKAYSYSGSSSTYGLLPVPVRTGYTFGGWWTGENGAGSQVEAGTSMVPESQTLYSKWTVGSYIVTLDNQGADVSGTSWVSVDYNGDMPPIKCPEKTGHAFMGYFAQTEGMGTQYYRADGTSRGNPWTVAANGTIYAHWQPNAYTVTFDPGDGGTGMTADMALTYGVETNLPAVAELGFTKEGYVFAGWTNGTDRVVFADGQAVSNLATTANATVTMYATWSKGYYYVEFDANGGDDGTMEIQRFTYDVPSALASNAFTRTGYDFAGWSWNSNATTNEIDFKDGEVVTNLVSVLDSTNTLYAVWSAESYKVLLNAAAGRGGYFLDGGATNFTMQAMVTYGSPYNLPTPQNKWPGMVFAGWKYVDGETGASNDLPESVPLYAEGVTNIVAQWTDGLAAALNAAGTKLEYCTGGRDLSNERDIDVFWSPGEKDGENVGQSGELPNVNSSYAYVRTTLSGPGVLTFRWRLNAPVGYGDASYGNYLGFFSGNDALVPALITYGTENSWQDTGWRDVTFTNRADSLEVEWRFWFNDDGYIQGGGTGWVDNVTWTPYGGGLQPGKVPLGANGGSPLTVGNGQTTVYVANTVKGWWYGLYSKTNLADTAEKWTILPSTVEYPTALQAANDDEPVSFAWPWNLSTDPQRFFKIILSEEDPRP